MGTAKGQVLCFLYFCRAVLTTASQWPARTQFFDIPSVTVCTGGRKNDPQWRSGVCQAWALTWQGDSRPGEGLESLLLIRKGEKWNESQQQHFMVPQFITQSSKIWDRHCAWLASWIPVSLTREALFSLLSCWLPSACSPPCLSGCLFARAFLYTLPDLTNARTKTTTNYMKKATAVTADSTMVYSSTLNPMFWGLMLCAWVCYCVLCGLTCLVFVSRVFSCFENTLWGDISHFL